MHLLKLCKIMTNCYQGKSYSSLQQASVNGNCITKDLLHLNDKQSKKPAVTEVHK